MRGLPGYGNSSISTRPGPFRIRDGDNVDITMDEDGTIVADGRTEVRGEPNENRALVPIPVDPENFTLDDQPNDTFPIVSSTGVGGEGCRAVAAAEDTPDNGGEAANDAGESTVPEGVIVSTIPDKTLANTGGPAPLLPLSALMVGAGLLGFAALRWR